MKCVAKFCTFVVVGFCIVYLLLVFKTDLIPDEIVQDSQSQRIVSRKTMFGYTISQKQLTDGNGSADSGVWNRGIIAVFDTPLILGGTIWVKKGRREVEIRLISLQLAVSRADFLIESGDWKKTVSLNSKEMISAGPDISVGWSPRDSQSVYIFADEFPFKDRSQMYSVKFSESGRYLKAPTD